MELVRKKSLVRPERSRTQRSKNSENGDNEQDARRLFHRRQILGDVPYRSDTVRSRRKMNANPKWWRIMIQILTFYLPEAVLRLFKKDEAIRIAFREKIALCTIIAFLMAITGFLTFGFNQAVCKPSTGLDASSFSAPGSNSKCAEILGSGFTSPFSCGTKRSSSDYLYCPSNDGTKPSGYYLSWKDIKSQNARGLNNSKLIVYNGKVLDIGDYSQKSDFLGSNVYNLVMSASGIDITYALLASNFKREADCLSEIFSIAYVESDSFGCVISQVILYLSLALIGGVVLIRFFLALFFHWVLKWKLGDADGSSSASFYANGKARLDRSNSIESLHNDPKSRKRMSKFTPVLPGEGPLANKANRASWYSTSKLSLHADEDKEDLAFIDLNKPHELIESDPLMNNPNLMHTLVMVPCYSEGAASIRPALESVANTDYPSTHKCIFAIADGIVQGAGNDKSTPEYLIEMMDIDPRFSKEDPKLGGMPPAFSYVAIADGKKRKNYARVYAGWYNPKGGQRQSLLTGEEDIGMDRTGTRKTVNYRKKGRVPMIVVVKVGNEDEANEPKPGNRGKRDSQVILMNFLNRAMFNDRMTELEFDIFYKLWTITGTHPIRFESVLMMDADTILHRDSIRHLVATMINDPKVIGLCGETQISNPWSSFFSMMQVFEYFISHHQSKAFETIFGVVTCLPGCFCMYRVSAPKGNHGFIVPILANPDIIEAYSENVVDTLHKKNLLLLGEDRYLSTLMLKTFPKRKMVFVPQALCSTEVPDNFWVLLSQRRRWINSTIHNLLELLLVRDLCGAFCFSMQFVIFIELMGTLVLPAAITFTIYVIIAIALSTTIPWMTVGLLLLILGLPGIFAVVMANKIAYLFWMIVYLISLPIWNFIMPLYAFWHFDDFSWGETRKTNADTKNEDHGRSNGKFDRSGINMKTWTQWMHERRLQAEEGSKNQLTVPKVPSRHSVYQMEDMEDVVSIAVPPRRIGMDTPIPSHRLSLPTSTLDELSQQESLNMAERLQTILNGSSIQPPKRKSSLGFGLSDSELKFLEENIPSPPPGTSILSPMDDIGSPMMDRAPTPPSKK